METICLDAKKSNMCGASICSGGKGIKMVCLEFGASEFGASEGMAKEGAPIWHAPEKCPILAQRFLEHRFFEAGHTKHGCADLPNIYRCQPCAGG